MTGCKTSTYVNLKRILKNIALMGEDAKVLRPIFFGASLLPFTKWNWGMRSIAVGFTVSRHIAKLASSHKPNSRAAALTKAKLK